MRRRWLRAGAGAAVASSGALTCGEATAPRGVAGRYTLVAIEGDTMPRRIHPSSDAHLVGARVVLARDSTFELREEIAYPSTPGRLPGDAPSAPLGPPRVFDSRGDYTARGDSVFLSFDAEFPGLPKSRPVPGAVRAGRLRLVMPRAEWEEWELRRGG